MEGKSYGVGAMEVDGYGVDGGKDGGKDGE